jgi:sodium transport system ATP-binding protein
MNEFRDVKCEALSTGTKQKVSIARTIVHNPPIMVFDEPTSGLDPIVARSLTNFIKSLKSQGKTVILSTHIMAEAEKLCDRIAVIHHGDVLMIGTLAEILQNTGAHNLEEAFFTIVKI